jgi:hypothetical protein
MSNAAKNLTLLTSVLLGSLLLCEVAFRLINGVSPFALTNFREAGAIRVNLNNAVRYDSKLGWVHRENLDLGGFQTGEYAIRHHSPGQTRVRKGAILVSGSSFTAGSDVANADTWPAQLEQILDRPVENAAVGGYGVDQIVMRAEQLLPIVEPEAIVIDLMESTVQWVGYSVFTMPKPYFTLMDGKLVEHNVPVPRSLPSDLLPRAGWLKSIGGYSLIVDRVMSTIDANTWHGQPGTVDRIQNDPIDVTCALLQRLKLQAEERNIPVVVLSLFSGEQIVELERPPQTVLRVEKCARLMGFRLAKAFDRMRALYREDPQNMEELYGRYKSYHNLFAHFTPRGNREIAIVVADALKAQPAKGEATDYQLPSFVPGDGRNLLVGSEKLEELVSGAPGVVFHSLPKPADGQAQEFQISSSGTEGQHYLSLKPIKVDEGPVTLSFEVKLEGSDMFRAQLIAGAGTGMLADLDVRRVQSATFAVGELELRNMHAEVVPLRDGWHRISVGATLPVAVDLNIIVQLKDEAAGIAFASNGETVLLRRVQLEHGQSASPYRPSSDGRKPQLVK